MLLAEPEAVVLVFPRARPGERLALYMRGLGSPRSLAALAFLAAAPWGVGEVVLPGGGLAPLTLAIGLGAALLVMITGALSALVEGPPETTLTFTAEGIEQDMRGRRVVHGWDWVIRYEIGPAEVEIVVRPPPMRSFRLAKPAPERLWVPRDRVDAETLARLELLLRTHARS